jgi:hypothetical protein
MNASARMSSSVMGEYLTISSGICSDDGAKRLVREEPGLATPPVVGPTPLHVLKDLGLYTSPEAKGTV